MTTGSSCSWRMSGSLKRQSERGHLKTPVDVLSWTLLWMYCPGLTCGCTVLDSPGDVLSWSHLWMYVLDWPVDVLSWSHLWMYCPGLSVDALYCPGHAGVAGRRADILTRKATSTSGLYLGGFEALRSLRHYPRAPSQGSHHNYSTWHASLFGCCC